MDQRTSDTSRQWQELASLLHREWQGRGIDPGHASALAAALLPHHPEMRNTLTHIQHRMGASRR